LQGNQFIELLSKARIYRIASAGYYTGDRQRKTKNPEKIENKTSRLCLGVCFSFSTSKVLYTNVFFFKKTEYISKADPKPHFTINTFGKDDKPIGVLYVYLPPGREGYLTPFKKPCTKALDVSSPDKSLL